MNIDSLGRTLGGYEFEFVCDIIPQNNNGVILDYRPQNQYLNKKGIPLNKYGGGIYCRFDIPNNWHDKSGVYALYVMDKLAYIGIAQNLYQRWNSGYGSISPRNCFIGGQSTNCKINSYIRDCYIGKKDVKLYFHETNDNRAIEKYLIEIFRPRLNKMFNSASGIKLDYNKSIHLKAFATDNIELVSAPPIKDNISKKDVVKYLLNLLKEAKINGKERVIVISGELHSAVSLRNAMPTACNAMYAVAVFYNHKILHTTVSGYSSTIKIEYYL